MPKNTGRGSRIGSPPDYYGHGMFMEVKKRGGLFESLYERKSIWKRMLSWFGDK